jgi:hypothetical protein
MFPNFRFLADSQGCQHMSSQTSSSAEENSGSSAESLSVLVAQQYSASAALRALDLRNRRLISGDLLHLQDVWPADMQVLNLVSV